MKKLLTVALIPITLIVAFVVASATPLTNCVNSMGFWQTHGSGACHRHGEQDFWPPDAIPMLLGNESYTEDELCSILNEPVNGNGLVSLAHQLIAAKLNIANGSDALCIQVSIDAADAMIGDLVVPPVGDGYLPPSQTSILVQLLTAYNEGELCSPPCGTPTPTPTASPEPSATPAPTQTPQPNCLNCAPSPSATPAPTQTPQPNCRNCTPGRAKRALSAQR